MAHDANETPVVEYRRRRRSGERILLSRTAVGFAAFGLILALVTIFFRINPVEGGVVREPLAGTWLVVPILVLSIPGWVGVMLGDMILPDRMLHIQDSYSAFVGGMLVGQFLFYWGVGAAVAAIRARLRARRGVIRS